MQRTALIVIDPQVGFCSREGSLAIDHGEHSLTNIQLALERIERFVESNEKLDVSLVVSEYSPGQFKDCGAMRNVCVPGANLDCLVASTILTDRANRIFLKRDESALSSPSFRDYVLELARMSQWELLVCGFLTEHCVLQTVLGLNDLLGGQMELRCDLDMCGSRDTKYLQTGLGSTSWAKARMQASGIKVSYEEK